MSTADDKSLMAMNAARMSDRSIASVLGKSWSEGRVRRRLDDLMTAANEKAFLAMRAGGMDDAALAAALGWTEEEVRRRRVDIETADATVIPFADTDAEAAPKPAARAGVNTVTRAFHLYGGGRGAAVMVGGQLLVFAETGNTQCEPGSHVAVEPGQGVWRLAELARG